MCLGKSFVCLDVSWIVHRQNCHVFTLYACLYDWGLWRWRGASQWTGAEELSSCTQSRIVWFTPLTVASELHKASCVCCALLLWPDFSITPKPSVCQVIFFTDANPLNWNFQLLFQWPWDSICLNHCAFFSWQCANSCFPLWKQNCIKI